MWLQTLDYDVDSSEEWEPEASDGEDVESVNGDDDEPEDEEVDDDENDGFFVEHGYLSEGEGDEDDEVSCCVMLVYQIHQCVIF